MSSRTTPEPTAQLRRSRTSVWRPACILRAAQHWAHSRPSYATPESSCSPRLRRRQAVRSPGRVVRAPSDLRSGCATRDRHAASQVRSRRALGARPAVAAMDQTPSRRTKPGTSSGSTTCRSSSSWAARSPTTSRTCYSSPCGRTSARSTSSIRSRSSNRSPTRASATAGSAGWPPASWIRWRRSVFRAWDPACATNTASSGRPFATAGSASSRITGWPGPTPGKCLGRTRPSKCGWPVRSTFRRVRSKSSRGGRPRCSAFHTTARWSGTAAGPSTRCASGRPRRRTISTSSSSAAATSSARWPRRSRPKR